MATCREPASVEYDLLYDDHYDALGNFRQCSTTSLPAGAPAAEPRLNPQDLRMFLGLALVLAVLPLLRDW